MNRGVDLWADPSKRQETGGEYNARRFLIQGRKKKKTSPGTGEGENKAGEFLGLYFYRQPTGGAWCGGRVVMIRGVELGRRAAVGSCRGRAREEFADWEPRRLRKLQGFLGAWKQEPGRNTGDPGRHTGKLGSWGVHGGTRRKHGN